ncbi:XyeB family radical SAM/SPASM peptide maturase [Kosakonia cowanii]|nr:XyeB family radical SAM/SPASM peptide maturase [Kosakonia cowanii]
MIKKKRIKILEIILKVSERCNINCTYCYVFNQGNEIAINSKPIASSETIKNLRSFFERASQEYKIETIQVDFHGGEPLMMGKSKFESACKELAAGDYNKTKLNLACQTNAILIDDEWIDIFSKYNISVGISIDGPKHINDRHRLDRKGRSTYEGTVKGLEMLQEAWKAGRLIDEPGILCVANPLVKGAEIYRHFADVLKCKKFDFLIPDESHDTCVNPEGLSDFFCSALDEFFSDADANVYVRYFHIHIQSMLKQEFNPVMGVSKSGNDALAFTVGSDGELYVDDTLRATNDPIFTPIGNIQHLTLSEILSSWQMQKYMNVDNQLPNVCTDCVWQKVCGGGRHIHRYSKASDFNRETVFCSSVKKFMSRVASHLIESGISEDIIMKNLEIKS